MTPALHALLAIYIAVFLAFVLVAGSIAFIKAVEDHEIWPLRMQATVLLVCVGWPLATLAFGIVFAWMEWMDWRDRKKPTPDSDDS